MRHDTPLIVTATPNVSWLHPEIRYPADAESMAAERFVAARLVRRFCTCTRRATGRRPSKRCARPV